MNTYTIKEMREKFDIPSSTLRYYEEIGLFPEVMRTETNQRIYTDEHIDRLHAINCFKRTGLPMAKMHDFFEYADRYDGRPRKRYYLPDEKDAAGSGPYTAESPLLQ